MGLIPGCRRAALGILIGHVLGGCASEPGEQTQELPPSQEPRPLVIHVIATASVEPATLEYAPDLIDRWFAIEAVPVEAMAGSGSLLRRIVFRGRVGRPQRTGVLEAGPVGSWLEQAGSAGDVDPGAGLLAAINAAGPVDLTAVVSPELGEGQALVLRGRVERIEFVTGAGIRYLAAFTDDYAPLTDANLYYFFEGLTFDGHTYVHLRLPVAAAALPELQEPGTLEAAAEFAAITDAYVDSVLEQLTLADPASFRPPLVRLDEFVRSISVR